MYKYSCLTSIKGRLRRCYPACYEALSTFYFFYLWSSKMNEVISTTPPPSSLWREPWNFSLPSKSCVLKQRAPLSHLKFKLLSARDSVAEYPNIDHFYDAVQYSTVLPRNFGCRSSCITRGPSLRHPSLHVAHFGGISLNGVKRENKREQLKHSAGRRRNHGDTKWLKGAQLAVCSLYITHKCFLYFILLRYHLHLGKNRLSFRRSTC